LLLQKISLIVVVLFQVTGFPVSKYPNVAKWYGKVKTEIAGYDELNAKGAEMFRQLFENTTTGKTKPT